MSEWKYTSYVQKGLSHEKSGSTCQDSVIVKEDEYCIVAALADGLGSLKKSDIAASEATQAVWKYFTSVGKNKLVLNSEERQKEFAQNIVQSITQVIKDKAMELGTPTSAMDCTLVFVYISKIHNYAITGRLGDSAICVIAQENSVVISDSAASANGTNAILDKDAPEHMKITAWNIEADKILGFILTSDGLENELYRKGSAYVNKSAEYYFNAVAVSPEPESKIAKRIQKLTAIKESPFDDDISIAVISRATDAISLPNDPTWLCSCGSRNRLQDTYCRHCGMDFVALYKNIRFREYGGKTAFFMEINQRPREEAKLVGLAGLRKNKTDLAGDEKDLNKKLLIAIGATCLVAGFLCGNLAAKIGIAKGMREVSRKLDVLMETVDCRSENGDETPKADDVPEAEGNTSEPSKIIEPEETVETESAGMLLVEILVKDGVSYYWGEIQDGLPHGQGALIEGGYRYEGQFNEGMKDGEFQVTPIKDPSRKLVIVYKDNQLVIEKLTFEEAVISQSNLRFREYAGLSSKEIDMLHKGDVVYITGADPVEIDDIEWVEIIYDGMIGWASSKGMERK